MKGSTTQSRTLDTLEAIKDDLMTSWYFRVWLLFWIVGGAVIFAAVVLFSTDHTFISPSSRLHASLVNASYLEFPRFQFRYGSTLSDPNKILPDTHCFHNNVALNVVACDGSGILNSHCLEFEADHSRNSYAYNHFNLDQGNRRIDCDVLTTTSAMLPPEALLFDILGKHWGQEQMVTQTLRPSDGIRIHISYTEYMKDGKTYTVDWDPYTTYDFPTFTPDYFKVRIVFNDFRVYSYNEVTSYNIVEWENCAWIGGFFLFVWMLHSLAMMLVGLFLDNNSLVLKSSVLNQPYTDYTEYSHNEPAKRVAGGGAEEFGKGHITSADL